MLCGTKKTSLVRSDFPIDYNDYFRDKATGQTYRTGPYI